MCTEEEVLPFSATRSKSSYPTLLLQCSIHFYYLIYFLKLRKSFLFPFASHLTFLQNSLEAMGVQEIKNRTENKGQPISYMGSHLCPSSVSSQSEIFVHKSYSSKNEYIPKVRKPYTIKRQREKWTEEEHQKFLEALKLHGRAWRHIEEHIGTKTAVQIRSHAQKFFSKVARGTDCETDGSLSSIEIPPPRPKKKPMHPYPRKIVDLLLKDLAVLNQPERSFSTDLLQTSILPTISSNTYSPAISELHNGCLSPNSCATDALSANLFPTEKDNECMTSGSIPDNNPSCSLSIKLFGKMVLVPDSRKPSSEITDEGDLDFLLGQRLLDNEQKTGGSSTGSSSGSVSDMGHGQKKSNAVESQHRPGFELRGHVQGFFPYERCVAEGDTNLVNIFEESDGQKIHVCS